MTGAAEAVGDVANGAAWARAVEPRAGEAIGDADHGACLNCGTPLIGHYCHACGQSAHVHRTLMSIVHDLLHGVFHFEGKIWRTVPMLVLHPGQLTRRYIAGERARFVSPLALYLFTVFLMFATFSALGPGDLSNGLSQGWSQSDRQSAQAQAATAQRLAAATRERVALLASHRPIAAADQRIADLTHDAAALDAVRQRIGGTTDAAPDDIHSNIAWIDHAIAHARENPGLALYKVQAAAYKYSWALIFLSTPLIALLFLWRRRFGLYDHAVFATYSISFMSLLAVALTLVLTVNGAGWLFGLLLALAPPAHIFAQLRGAYGLSVFSALWRTVLLLIFSTVALALFALGVIALEMAH